jgi:hypothetical protein
MVRVLCLAPAFAALAACVAKPTTYDEALASMKSSSSGFHYSNGTHTIRGKGENLTIEVAQQPTLKCKAKNE